MTTFLWIVSSGVVMSAVALVGGATLWLRAERLERLLLPMVAFAECLREGRSSGGDSLLRELSAGLRRRIRGRDTVARLGRDEFGILLEHCTPERAAHIAEQLRSEIAEHRLPVILKPTR